MPRKHVNLPESLPPAALNGDQGARYVGVSLRQFDNLVNRGVMPQPRALGARKIWLVSELDVALERLPKSYIGERIV